MELSIYEEQEEAHNDATIMTEAMKVEVRTLVDRIVGGGGIGQSNVVEKLIKSPSAMSASGPLLCHGGSLDPPYLSSR